MAVAVAVAVVPMVVPIEEGLAVGARVFDAAKAFGQVGPVLHGLELRLRAAFKTPSVTSAKRSVTFPNSAVTMPKRSVTFAEIRTRAWRRPEG